ncbi:MAG: ABC transporter permease [Myxococcota bacterium]
MKAWQKKASADLQAAPLKVALLATAIAVGTAAVMAAFGSRFVLEREIAASFLGSRPAAVVIWTDHVDSSLLRRVSKLEGVAGTDARRLIRARVEVEEDDWRSLLLYGVRSFREIAVSRIYPTAGAWPPLDGSVLLERSAIPVVRTGAGDVLRLRLPGVSHVQSVGVSGIAADPGRAPGWQDNLGYAYASPATLAGLGVGENLNELHVDVAGDRRRAQRVADSVRSLMIELGYPIHRVEVPPRQHPHADHMQAMLLLLQVLAVLSLMLSALLAWNLFAAILARESRQVAVMKAIGAEPGAIAWIYLMHAAMIAIPASVVGSLLGLPVSTACSRFAAAQLNLYEPSLAPPLWVIAAALLSGFAIPIFASLVPIRRATRLTVREALQDVGIRWTWSSSVLHLGARLPVAVRLSLRNSLRRPGRFALTVVCLALGGGMLMTAANVYRSLVAAVDDALSSRGDDIEVRLLQPAVTTDLVASLSSIEGVKRVSPWGAVLAGFQLSERAGGETTAGRYGLLAPPGGELPPTTRIVEGRWLQSADPKLEIVVNRQLLALEPHLSPGAETVVFVGDRATPANVVGVAEEVAPASAYVTREGMAVVLGRAGMSGGARIELDEGAELSRVAAEVEEVVANQGWFPVYFMNREELRTAMVDHFMILLVVLNALALAAIVVGVLGLSTTVSLNVLERRREIGVTKAIGASAGSVRRMVLLEGMMTTIMSLVIAGIASVPLSVFVGYVAGNHGLHVSLPYETSIRAIAVWIAVAIAATVIACLGPAERSVRQPVRDLVVYE